MIAVTLKSARITPEDAYWMTGACSRQIRQHVAPAWGRVPEIVNFYPGGVVPNGAWEIAIFDSPDSAGALGYHSLTPQGLPYGRVFINPVLDDGGTVMTGENSVSAVLSHEVAETFCDPTINLWADGPNSQDWAIEVGDPVENDSYPIMAGPISVAVSNFVFPAWFSATPLPGAQFDYMRRCTAPYQITTGGYQVVRTAGQSSQITARTGAVAAFQRHRADFPAARSFKRLHRKP